MPAVTTYYATPAELQTELGVTSTTLTDEAASRLIRSAEGEVDRLIGVRPIDTLTGRRVAQGDVDAWQWAKIKLATLILASDLYADPNAVDTPAWNSVSGPDFSFSGPVHSSNRRALNELDATGLRRLSGLAGRVAGSRYSSFFAATRHNGT